MPESPGSVPTRLLLRPPPQPDEWIGSWIVRLAVANYATMPESLRKLLNLLGIQASEEQLTDHHLNILSAATGADLVRLQSLNALPSDLIRN
ncbi:TniQ family protein [Deinococcus radiomollis]|uniref:TniQ family protein n=1 Tax=Deinococcus radiomollis TaxID=468916 RepID=UPI0038911C09